MNEFVYEDPTSRNKQILVLTILLVLVGSIIILDTSQILTKSTTLNSLIAHISAEISQVSSIGLLYMGLLGGLFFVPIPLEPLFLLGLKNGNPGIWSMFLTLAGFSTSLVISYALGAKLSSYLITIIDKKKLYDIKRKVNKYGSGVIFLFGLAPLPIPILSFALGIARYNLLRMCVYAFSGLIIKFLIMIWWSKSFL